MDPGLRRGDDAEALLIDDRLQHRVLEIALH
jgi:hypothetical protein